MKRIRVIEPTRAPTFAERLEARARQVIAQQRREAGRASVRETLADRIALTLGQLHDLRQSHLAVERNLTSQEIYVGTEILQRTPREPVYVDPRLPERDMLRGRLIALESERRRHLLVREQAVRGLHERLLEDMSHLAALG